MPSTQLTVSLNNFYYWYQDKALSKVLSWVIPLYAKKVNGFEISLSFNQCDSWISKLSNSNQCLPEIYSCISKHAQSAVLECKNNSIHLEDIKSLPIGKEAWLAECLNKIKQHTGILNFTTHPDEVSFNRWAIIASNLDSKISLSIENMCKRKLNYKRLDEFAAILIENPNINVTFDTSHWLELGNSLSSPEMIYFLRQFANRIDKIHCSAPYSCDELYKSCPETPHFAFYNSEHQDCLIDLINLFSYTNALIVLEGLVPVQGIEILDREIALITNLIDQASAPIEQRRLNR